MCGPILTLLRESLQIPILDTMLNRSLMQLNKRNLGSEQNKSTPFQNKRVNLPLNHQDGHHLVILDLKDLTTAQLVPIAVMVEPLWMLILRPVFLLALRSQAPMLKSCLDNGSFKQVLAKVSKQEIISGLLDISFKGQLKTSMCQLALSQSFLKIGMELAVILTIQLKT